MHSEVTMRGLLWMLLLLAALATPVRGVPAGHSDHAPHQTAAASQPAGAGDCSEEGPLFGDACRYCRCTTQHSCQLEAVECDWDVRRDDYVRRGCRPAYTGGGGACCPAVVCPTLPPTATEPHQRPHVLTESSADAESGDAHPQLSNRPTHFDNSTEHRDQHAKHNSKPNDSGNVGVDSIMNQVEQSSSDASGINTDLDVTSTSQTIGFPSKSKTPPEAMTSATLPGAQEQDSVPVSPSRHESPVPAPTAEGEGPVPASPVVTETGPVTVPPAEEAAHIEAALFAGAAAEQAAAEVQEQFLPASQPVAATEQRKASAPLVPGSGKYDVEGYVQDLALAASVIDSVPVQEIGAGPGQEPVQTVEPVHDQENATVSQTGSTFISTPEASADVVQTNTESGNGAVDTISGSPDSASVEPSTLAYNNSFSPISLSEELPAADGVSSITGASSEVPSPLPVATDPDELQYASAPLSGPTQSDLKSAELSSVKSGVDGEELRSMEVGLAPEKRPVNGSVSYDEMASVERGMGPIKVTSSENGDVTPAELAPVKTVVEQLDSLRSGVGQVELDPVSGSRDAVEGGEGAAEASAEGPGDTDEFIDLVIDSGLLRDAGHY